MAMSTYLDPGRPIEILLVEDNPGDVRLTQEALHAAKAPALIPNLPTKLMDFLLNVADLGETDTILKMLSLIDAALVASLVVMVIISGYENFVSRFDKAEGELAWLGKIDAGSLKIKVASTIVAISSIHLLQVFLNAAQYSEPKLMWLTIMHMAFVVSALFLAYIDKVMAETKKAKGE